LAKGVTTARDLGGVFDIPLYIRDAIARRDIPGPRLIACRRPISVTGGHGWFISTEAVGADGFRNAAREQLKAGADFVKCITSHEPVDMPGFEKARAEVTSEEMAAAFEVAHDWGRLACCHATCSTAIARALKAGVDLVEHGHYLTDELAEEMASRNVVLTPTLSTYDVQIMNKRVSQGEPWAVAHEILIPGHQAAFAAAIRAGVKMTVGTDSLGIYAEEVDLMRRMGMSPRESLFACTSNAARALRMDAEIGSVAEGRIADLVVLRTDPLQDPYALEDIDLVVKDGQVYRPSDLAYVDSLASSPTMMELASREQPAG
jgi:imidazolonepropionase-like amidohydrolase